MEIPTFQPDEARRRAFRAPTYWRATILIAVLSTAMAAVPADAQDAQKTQSGSPGLSGAIMPQEFDWIAATGDPRIYPILEQAFDLEEHKDYEAAIEKYKQLLDLGTLGKGVAPTFNSIAGCYQQLGNFAEQVNWAKKATDADPEFALGYINLGNAYAGLGDLDQAARAFTQFVTLQPKDPKGYYSLGVTADQQRNWSKAESFYKKSIAVDPNFTNGHYNLAATYANQRKFKLAIGELQKVIALDPTNEGARAMLAEIKKLQKP
jgi:tetratricopeptide (TPR) repeat protein